MRRFIRVPPLPFTATVDDAAAAIPYPLRVLARASAQGLSHCRYGIYRRADVRCCMHHSFQTAFKCQSSRPPTCHWQWCSDGRSPFTLSSTTACKYQDDNCRSRSRPSCSRQLRPLYDLVSSLI